MVDLGIVEKLHPPAERWRGFVPINAGRRKGLRIVFDNKNLNEENTVKYSKILLATKKGGVSQPAEQKCDQDTHTNIVSLPAPY